MVEAKPKKKDGFAQLASYTYRLLYARPDLQGVYCVTVQSTWYQIVWSDSSGVVASPKSPWDQLDLLVGYIYSLYYPPDHHCLHDSTLEIDVQGRMYRRGKERSAPVPRVRWSISCSNDLTFSG